MKFKYRGLCYLEEGGRGGPLWRVSCKTGAKLERLKSGKGRLQESMIVELREAAGASRMTTPEVKRIPDGFCKFIAGKHHLCDESGSLKLDENGRLIPVDQETIELSESRPAADGLTVAEIQGRVTRDRQRADKIKRDILALYESHKQRYLDEGLELDEAERGALAMTTGHADRTLDQHIRIRQEAAARQARIDSGEVERRSAVRLTVQEKAKLVVGHKRALEDMTRKYLKEGRSKEEAEQMAQTFVGPAPKAVYEAEEAAIVANLS